MSKNIFICIAFCSIIFKIILFIQVENDNQYMSSDSYGYIDNAKSILDRGTFTSTISFKHFPETVRTPGYPLIIAIIYKVMGFDVQNVILFQIVLNILCSFFIYKICTLLRNESVGYFASMIFLLDPLTTGHIYKMLSETTFTFFFIIFIFFSIKWIKIPRAFSYPIFSGLCLSISTLIRPITYFLIPVISLAAINYLVSIKKNYLYIFKSLMLFLLPCLILIGGWQIRNHLVANNGVFSQISSLNLIYYRVADVVCMRDNIDMDKSRKKLIGEHINHPWSFLNKYSSEKINKKWDHISKLILLENPLLAFKSFLRNSLNMFIGPGDSLVNYIIGGESYYLGPLGDLFRLSYKGYIEKWIVSEPMVFIYFTFSTIFLLTIYIYSFYYFYIIIKEHKINQSEILLFGLLLYFIVISSGPESYARFRIPIMPILCIFSSIGFEFYNKNKIEFGKKKKLNKNK